ncbi:thioredoxin family protein [Maribacter dokdonensis]|uniref:thioredoxin family protein n=1 Tax=Maribacter dokdonensis TaxID=320912 RepID=UPI001C083993|nr:thioredoxin family protein [Maribacter dokdonensis]MBU2902179.1 thioredoxin family protein [Maribacter dokdonensis]
MRKLFKKTIASENPTLVYFFASWCVPCKLMRPTVEKIVEEVATAINSLEIDVELEKAIVKKYKIKGVPTLVLFKNGLPMWRHTGVMPIEDIRLAINEHR